MQNHKLTGQCLCATIQFAVDGPDKGCAHCHCESCRRAHGAPMVTWVVMADTGFEIVTGKITWYESSPGTERGFCDICGTTMFFRSKRCPGEIHIARANLLGELDIRPAYHVFYDQRAGWWSTEDKLTILNSDSPELARYQD